MQDIDRVPKQRQLCKQINNSTHSLVKQITDISASAQTTHTRMRNGVGGGNQTDREYRLEAWMDAPHSAVNVCPAPLTLHHTAQSQFDWIAFVCKSVQPN